MNVDINPEFDWEQYHEHSYARPLCFFTGLISGYLAGIWALVETDGLAAKFLAGIVVSLLCGKLFVVGHDAAHGSFVPSRSLNRAIAILSLAASFHVFALWEHGHNRIHHGLTNLRQRDFVWRPLSIRDYDESSPLRQWLEKLYRHHSGVGLCPYYLIEILLKRMVWNKRHLLGARRTTVATAGACYLLWVCIVGFLTFGKLLMHGAADSGIAIAINVCVGFLLPMLYLCWALGFVVFFNHTHPDIRWFGNRRHWNFWKAQAECTLYVEFSGISEFLLPSKVMNHVAHHMDPKIPVRYLRKAQEDFCRAHPSAVKTEKWSKYVRWKIMKRCKLYDYDHDQWTDFAGKPTGPVLA